MKFSKKKYFMLFILIFAIPIIMLLWSAYNDGKIYCEKGGLLGSTDYVNLKFVSLPKERAEMLCEKSSLFDLIQLGYYYHD